MTKKEKKYMSLIESMKTTLFDISPTKVVFRCEEDKRFFMDQKTDRNFTIGSIDMLDSIKINANLERRARDNKKSGPKSEVYVKEDVKIDEDVTKEDWLPPTVSRNHKVKLQRNTDVNITLNKRKWLDTACAMADKTVTSHRTALQLAVSSVSSAEGASDLTFSVSTMRRKRQKVRSAIADTVKEAVRRELREGNKYILHWDEKSLQGRRHVDTSREYMAVVLVNVVSGKTSLLNVLFYG